VFAFFFAPIAVLTGWTGGRNILPLREAEFVRRTVNNFSGRWILAPPPTPGVQIRTVPVGEVTTGGPNYDTSTFYFAGLTSDTLFSSATIGANFDAVSGFNVDYLVVGIFVPEPSALSLFAIGGVACLVVARRKSASQDAPGIAPSGRGELR
jgi:PEP-CTERM motif-containing protein